MKKSEEIALNKQIRSQFTFDTLKMLFCEDYYSKNNILVRQPRIGEIMEIGEERFYQNLNIWITNPTSYRVALWNQEPRIDWCKITDYELFCGFFKAINPDVIKIVFPDLDIASFDVYEKQISENEREILLYSEEHDQFINNIIYLEISQYLRTLFNIFPKDEFAKGTATKEAIIWEEEQSAQRNKDKGYKSSLFPLISSCINYPGFKHSLKDLKDVGIFEFMDAVSRIQIFENTRALLVGSMSGFADTSKVDKDNFNFMRDYTVTKEKVYSEKEKEKFKQIQVYGS